MEMTKVKSSIISRVGYDEKAQQLDVQFHNGKVYKYKGVPASTHRELMTASSVGRCFNAAVSKKFAFSKA